MKSFTRRQIVNALLVTLFILAAIGSEPGSAASLSQAPPSKPESKLILRAGYTDTPSQHIPPPAGFSTSRQPDAATITVNYEGTWDQAARDAFQYAVDVWESQLNSSVEIVVEAHWSPLGSESGILGGATGDIVIGFSGAPVADTWYSAALGHTLSGQDLNDNDSYDFDKDGLDADVEIYAEFNQDFPDWYFGTDGNTPSDKWDFASVVLHELCHGLGFFGSMRVYEGTGYWGWGSGYPTIYDRFTENGSGAQLLTAFPNYSAALAAQLQSENIYFDGPNANAANGGSRPELYAPNLWTQGSSYSHLDESFNGTPNALMTYALNNGESAHDPGPVVRGMFQDMGWTFVAPTYPDLHLAMHVTEGLNLDPGDSVTFVLSIENTGDAAATGIVLTDTLPSDILSPSWNASSSLSGATERGGTPYVWDLPDLAAGASGEIEIYGTINPALLPSDWSIVNEASISTTAQEENEDDNSTRAVLGGEQNYLPLVLRQ
jgi:uncharacterized repeat protein (TIGR01451 family)